MKTILNLLLVVLIFSSCSNDDDGIQIIQSDCNALSEVLSNDDFAAITDTVFIISNVTLEEDCLSITIGDSGCDPNNWEMNLFSTDAFFLGLPTIRAVKLEVINNEACLAVFEKTKTFDLIPFQIENQNEIILDIEGWDSQISYQY